MGVRLSALSARRPLPPGRFLVLISVRGWVDLRIRSTEKSSYLNGNRTRDLPACSIVSESTTLPRAPRSWKHRHLMKVSLCLEGETCGPTNMYSCNAFMFCTWQKWHVKSSWESENFRYGHSNPYVPIHIITCRRRRFGTRSSIRA
jgi:hypothetical protein